QFGRHVMLVKRFDGMPVQAKFLGDILKGAHPAAPPHIPSKPLRIRGIVGKNVEALALHRAAASALNPPYLDLQVDARVAAGQVAHPPGLAVVPAHVRSTTVLADGSQELDMRPEDAYVCVKYLSRNHASFCNRIQSQIPTARLALRQFPDRFYLHDCS